MQSIIILNNLASTCPLSVGQTLKIPYPTATQPALPTNTLQAGDTTKAACDKVVVTVQQNDTLSSIAANYAVPIQAIKDFNGLSTDNVFLGESLAVPLCMRAATPGPTPTPTIPPPYPAPNLLLPADGAAFTLANDVVTLQWASIGTLRSNEEYQVVIEDITADQGRRIEDYVTDTKYIIPTSSVQPTTLHTSYAGMSYRYAKSELTARGNQSGIQRAHKATNESSHGLVRPWREPQRHNDQRLPKQ